MSSDSSTQSSAHAHSHGGVENAHVIDVITFDDKKGEVTLAMREPRAWDGSDVRLFQLQEKINAYLSFALDGEMNEAYPAFAGREIRLRLDCAAEPDARTLDFIRIVREQIGYQGIAFDVNTGAVGAQQAEGHAHSGCACGAAHRCGE